MLERISRITLCLSAGLALLGFGLASAQLTQGTDDGSSTGFPDPDNWTETIYDTDTYTTTITFELNPCEWVVYLDEDGSPHSCLPRDVDCDTLDVMETKLVDALLVWDNVDSDALTFVVSQPATCEPGCTVNDTDVWEDDGDWVVTRTYDVAGQLDEEDCPDADTGALDGGAGLRFYDDPTGNTDERWVRECDLLFFEDKWDNALSTDCRDEFSELQCGGAWQMALAHELGHCLGIGHSYLTRKTLGPLKDDLASPPESITLAKALPSIMSYDRIGSVEVGEDGLNPYDKAVYLNAYSDGPDTTNYFAAYGTVKDDCSSGDLQFGVGVFALEKFDDGGTTKWRAVQMSVSGMEPLGEGEFRLEHLNRSEDYRLLVADLRDTNQVLAHGWDFDDTSGSTPGLNTFLTDEWSETNSGDAYKYEMSAKFTTGFDYELFAEFTEPA